MSLSLLLPLSPSLSASLWYSPSDLHNLAFFFCIISCRLYNSHLFFFFSCCLLFCFCLSPSVSPSHILFRIQAITSRRWLSSLVYVGDPWWVCVCVCILLERLFLSQIAWIYVQSMASLKWDDKHSTRSTFFLIDRRPFVEYSKKNCQRGETPTGCRNGENGFAFFAEVAITRLMAMATTRKITARSYHQKQEPTTSAARIMRNEVMSDGQIIKPNFSVSLSQMDEGVGGWVGVKEAAWIVLSHQCGKRSHASSTRLMRRQTELDDEQCGSLNRPVQIFPSSLLARNLINSAREVLRWVNPWHWFDDIILRCEDSHR